MEKMAVARRMGQAPWPKEWRKNEVCAMAQRTNLWPIAARGSQWGSQRIDGGTSQWRGHKNRRQIVARGMRNQGQKNRKIVARAKEYRRQIVARRGQAQRRGQRNIGDELSRWGKREGAAKRNRLRRIVARGQARTATKGKANTRAQPRNNNQNDEG